MVDRWKSEISSFYPSFFLNAAKAACVFSLKKKAILPKQNKSLEEAFHRLQEAKENLSNPNEEYIIKMSRFIKAWQEYEREKKR